MLSMVLCPFTSLIDCFGWLTQGRNERKSTQSPLQSKVDEIFWKEIIDRNSHWKGVRQEEWDSFMQDTKKRDDPANPLVVVLREKPHTVGTAIDLGCGTGADTLYLLNRGWKVFAIDSNVNGLKILQERVNEICPQYIGNLTIIHSTMEDYAFDQEFDLINATQSFPFCNPAKFRQVWERLVKALKPGGIFNGQFYDQPNQYCQLESTMYMNANQVSWLMQQDFNECLLGVEPSEDGLTICAAGLRKAKLDEQDEALDDKKTS